MSTDFLNRRMDLLHECRNFGFIDEFGTVIDVNGDNYLTMDTSYPVRLAGKVIKLFTAVSDYNRQKFIIRNSNKDTILEVNADNIYDFAGNCWEWTQEAYSPHYRVSRGGIYDDSGSNYPASYRRLNNIPTNGSSNERFSFHFNSATLRV